MFSRLRLGKRKLISLRTRYFRLTLLVTIGITTVALFFYQQTTATQHSVAERLAIIEKDHDILETVKIDLVEFYRNIDLYLHDPSQGNHAEITERHITSALVKVSGLSSIHLLDSSEIEGVPEELANQLRELGNNITKLTALRMDITQQYPGVSLSAFEMAPPQQSVSNSLQILIDEIESGSLAPESSEIYPLLLKSHTLWIKQISQMRIYLANRLVSFNKDILFSQGSSLSDLHQQFLLETEMLAKLYTTEDSFEGESAIASVRQNAAEWFRLFQQVRLISESDKWRGDSHMMRNVILPLTDEISSSIFRIMRWMVAQEEHAAEQLREKTDALSTLLFSIISLFLLLTLGLLFSLDLMVFRPIASVAEALKSKAFNHETPTLITSKAKEIYQLTEAFQHMDEEISQRQHDLEHHALHDHLTGLPNRFMLTQRIEYQLLTAERNDKQFALFLMDLNNFKDVNDSLGHAAGDSLLIRVAAQLSESVRKADTVARLGGDEFAVLLPETSVEDAEMLARKILNVFEQPLLIDGNSIAIGLSIGIVNYPEDGRDTKLLMQHADIAMYHAKRHKTGFSYYSSNEDFYYANRLSLIADLNKALAEETLELYFQPQIELKTGKLSAAEALLRWDHPEHGQIQSEKIIELAEYSGIINKLSIWIIDKAIEQCARWHKKGCQISLSVNLSVQDLANQIFCQQVEPLLMRHGLPPHYLTLELTESSMMENPARSIDILNALSSLGIKLSIDDFGTGFSSLSYLKKLPVNELKIDKSFVLDMERNESDRVIVQSTINLAHNLGLAVIAEGIENTTLLESVSRLGCDYVQGYLFGSPKSSEAFLDFMEEPLNTQLTEHFAHPAIEPA